MRMGEYRPNCVGFFGIVLLLMVSNTIYSPPQAANFVGKWQMAMERGSPAKGGGGNGGGQIRGGEAQTLTITQEGDRIRVTHKTARSEGVFDAIVSDNAISWTETGQGSDRNSKSIEYKAIVDGDEMKGMVRGGQFNRQFKAKRLS